MSSEDMEVINLVRENHKLRRTVGVIMPAKQVAKVVRLSQRNGEVLEALADANRRRTAAENAMHRMQAAEADRMEQRELSQARQKVLLPAAAVFGCGLFGLGAVLGWAEPGFCAACAAPFVVAGFLPWAPWRTGHGA